MRVRTAGYGIFQQKRSGRPFIIKVNYASGFTVTLPLSGTCNFIVDWGDGSVGQVTSATDNDRIHTYASGGTYTITMTGILEGFQVNNGALKSYLIEVTQWGRTNLKYLQAGFFGCNRLTACYGVLDSSQINSFGGTFRNCTALTTIETVSTLVTSACTMIGGMFNACSSLTSLDLSGWDTSNVTTFYGLYGGWEGSPFANCGNLVTLNMSGWDTSKFNHVSLAFLNCAKLTTITGVENLVKSSCTALSQTFEGCKKLTSINTTNWDTSNILSYFNTFKDCQVLNNIDVSVFTINTTNPVNMSSMFHGCNILSSLDLTGWDTSKVTTFANTFFNCYKLASITNTVNLVTSACTSLSGTFYNCNWLTSLDTSGWDTSNVVTMGGSGGTWEGGTFALCVRLQSLDASSWNTSKVTSFGSTFIYCQALTVITGMSNLVQSACTNMHNMFQHCWELLSIDMTNWNTSNVTAMVSTFNDCRKITSLDFSGLNTAKVVSFSGAFSYCNLLQSISNTSNLVTSACTTTGINSMLRNSPQLATIDTSGWNTSNITNLAAFAFACNSLNPLDVSGWDVSKVTTTQDAFNMCSSLTTINISGWNLANVTNTAFMFANCVGLTSLTLPASLSRVDSSFATGCSGITVYNIYRATAPTVSGTPFGNYAKPLHVPVGATGYDVAPWTTAAIFTQPINYDL